MMIYNSSDTDIRFYTNTNERFNINNNGGFGLGGDNYGSSGQVLTSAGSGGVPTWTTISTAGTGETYVKLDTGGSLSNTGTNTYAGYNSGASLAGSSERNTFYGQYSGNATT